MREVIQKRKPASELQTRRSVAVADTHRKTRLPGVPTDCRGHQSPLPGVAGIKEVTRKVPVSVQCMLWGRAAGRCEFAGCNECLWKSRVTQEQVNIAEKAHIYAFRTGGARGNHSLAPRDVHDLSNLILVCHGCHRKIDKERDGGRYSASLLQQMKAVHEQRIERVAGIAPEKTSHVLLYGANIGEHSSPLSYSEAAYALFPIRYPASDRALELSVHNSSLAERDLGFWESESRKVKKLVRCTAVISPDNPKAHG